MQNNLIYDLEKGSSTFGGLILTLDVNAEAKKFYFKCYSPGYNFFNFDDFNHGAVILRATRSMEPKEEGIVISHNAIEEVFETDNLKEWTPLSLKNPDSLSYVLREEDSDLRKVIVLKLEEIKAS